MTDPEAVDAAPTEETQSDTIPRTEAQKAFAARDKARAELKETRARLEAISKAQADAERQKAEADGDLLKQLDILKAERDTLASQYTEATTLLGTIKSEQRQTRIEQSILANVPDPKNHAATAVIVNSFLSRASDDASDEDVTRAALDEVKRVASHFLDQPRPGHSTGFIPPEGTHTLTRASVVAETEKMMRDSGRRGFKKLL